MDRSSYLKTLDVAGSEIRYYDITQLEKEGIADISRLPFSIRILVENLLRKMDGQVVKAADLLNICRWQKTYDAPVEIPHHPARVLMQDFTGVPAVVDLAAMRDAVKAAGSDPSVVNPLIPVELVVDHSVQLDYSGTQEALTRNVEMEYQRNIERYKLLKWAQNSFDNFKVVPPNSGICHQVNLEYLSRVMVREEQEDGGTLVLPDTLVGTDSHTTMINGMGIMGWGVGGIEAEAVMLGQPYVMSIPEVIGVRLVNALRPGVTATDLVLTITEKLRALNVVEKFVEFFGPGMKALGVTDRATIANMAPEYGATMGFFPVDEKTIEYMEMTARSDQTPLIEAATRACGLFFTGEESIDYTQVVEVDLAQVVPSLAGPSRPQDRVAVNDVETAFNTLLHCDHKRDVSIETISQFLDESGCVTGREPSCEPSGKRNVTVNVNGREVKLGDGSLVIAAITSCTNTSNPAGLIGAGLLARNAVKRGLSVPFHVKTSLAPGSRVVEDYLTQAGLMPYLEALGFHVAGFGCTTCIGNSGPLAPAIEHAIKDNDLTVAAILSGNRNFEARIHQSIKGNFLASPMLVVAFAMAGRIDVDLLKRPLAMDPNGKPVYLEEIWPRQEEILALAGAHVRPEQFAQRYAAIYDGDVFWKNLEVEKSVTFDWDPDSTYIKNPPYFEGFSKDPALPEDIRDARALLLMGDSVTTDHISPAGAIPEAYPAGKYLVAHGITPADFNSYGARRGNHEVMMRGTFGNIRIKNQLVAPKEGSFTRKFPEDREMYVYDAAMDYKTQSVPLVVLGGTEYGTGSSRDWAAKGSNLLGVRAVIARSYERIHRSNLVGMGVLPLQFKNGEGWESLSLDGSETFSIQGISDVVPQKMLTVTAKRSDGSETAFEVQARLNTDIDVRYFQNGGILPYVLRQLIS